MKKSIGLKFPLIPNNKGNFDVLKTTEAIIEQNILIFLLTSKNTRVMNRRLGLNLRRYLGEPLNDDLKSVLEETIQNAVSGEFSNDISNPNIQIEQDSPESFDVFITFYHRSDLQRRDPRKITITVR